MTARPAREDPGAGSRRSDPPGARDGDGGAPRRRRRSGGGQHVGGGDDPVRDAHPAPRPRGRAGSRHGRGTPLLRGPARAERSQSSEEIPVPHVRLTYLDAGNAYVQLVEPLDRTLRSRCGSTSTARGLHHICFGVDDVAGAVGELGDGSSAVSLGTGRGRVSGFVTTGGQPRGADRVHRVRPSRGTSTRCPASSTGARPRFSRPLLCARLRRVGRAAPRTSDGRLDRGQRWAPHGSRTDGRSCGSGGAP